MTGAKSEILVDLPGPKGSSSEGSRAQLWAQWYHDFYNTIATILDVY